MVGWLVGWFQARELFVASGGNIKAKYITHAVTMPFRRMDSSISIVEELLPKIITKCKGLAIERVAITLLGTGIGRLDKEDVIAIYVKYFDLIEDIGVKIILG